MHDLKFLKYFYRKGITILFLYQYYFKVLFYTFKTLTTMHRMFWYFSHRCRRSSGSHSLSHTLPPHPPQPPHPTTLTVRPNKYVIQKIKEEMSNSQIFLFLLDIKKGISKAYEFLFQTPKAWNVEKFLYMLYKNYLLILMGCKVRIQ